MDNEVYSVYVLKNDEGRLYVGFTTNLEKRIRQHQSNEGGWTRNKGPWELVYHETFVKHSEAIKRERNLKHGQTNKRLRKHLIVSQR